MAAKKKHGLQWLLVILAGIFLFGLVMLGGAGASVSLLHEGSEVEASEKAVSRLESYIETQSEQQTAIINAAEEEMKRRKEKNIRGGDDYITEFQSEQTSQSSEQNSNQNSQQSESSKTEEKDTGGKGLINAQWDSYFVGVCIKRAGTDITAWNAHPSIFATKLNKQKQFSLPENYIPKVGDIIFFGKPVKALSASTAINAIYCGIVSKIETITEGTTITAMRINVIEPDTAGDIEQGNYDHRTSHVKNYVYDLYDTKGSNHHGSDSFESIIGYGTVITDRKKETSAEPSDDTRAHQDARETSGDVLIYKIELKSTYEEAEKENNKP